MDIGYWLLEIGYWEKTIRESSLQKRVSIAFGSDGFSVGGIHESPGPGMPDAGYRYFSLRPTTYDLPPTPSFLKEN
ncbi:MAG: hypothetical protein GY757_61900 [bacterium]|nr:hypothetical protein [bacterium]